MNKKELKEYFNNTELDIQSAQSALLPCDMVYQAYHRSVKTHGGDYSPCFGFGYLADRRNDFFHYAFIAPKEKIDRIADDIFSDFLAKPRSIAEKIREHKSRHSQARKIWLDFLKKQPARKEDILRYFNSFTAETQKWWEYTVIGEEKGEIINRLIIPEIAERHRWTQEYAQKIMGVLTHPRKMTPMNSARVEFLRLTLSILCRPDMSSALERKDFVRIIADQQICRSINRYIKDYFWLRTNFYEALIITPHSLLADISQESKKGSSRLRTEMKELIRSVAQIQKEKERILKRYAFTGRDKKLIYFSRTIVAWIEMRKYQMMLQMHYFFRLTALLAISFQVKYRDLCLYYLSEARKIDQGFRLTRQEIARREKGVMLIFERNRKKVSFYGRDALELYQAASAKRVRSLQGTVAYKGKEQIISGTARIIRHPGQELFKEGDILVASMTRVEYVPLMKRAQAVITNEGGIGCHAAIVSREMKKPCIVGTKHATSFLKSGDRVEMDLKTGEIRKK